MLSPIWRGPEVGWPGARGEKPGLVEWRWIGSPQDLNREGTWEGSDAVACVHSSGSANKNWVLLTQHGLQGFPALLAPALIVNKDEVLHPLQCLLICPENPEGGWVS